MKKAILIAITAAACAIAAAAQRTHTVTSGETLESIASAYGITADDIIEANPDAKSLFYAGLKLNIPMGGALATDAFTSNVAQSTSDRDHYRRSSLCLVLLAHSDKQYAEAMTRVFEDFPMPARYNEHNVDVRVIQVQGKQSKKDIDLLLRRHDIAKSVVSRWFNRSYDGKMNMDLIHERGGYGAFHDDYTRALNTVRGTALLREEGIELLESTFVMVCDMDYIDKKKGFHIGSVVAQIGSMVLEGMATVEAVKAQQAYNEGNYDRAASKAQSASTWHAGSQLAGTASEVLDDIGGFRVKIHAYLYRLNWNEQTTRNMFNTYWVDDNTPRGEAKRRCETFDNARFGLEYIGDYKEASGKTILLSWSNEDEVILDVCERAVAKSITSLAKEFEVFRPRTPFYFEGQVLYSHIGTKEDVTLGKRYEIVQRTRDKKGHTSYKRIGEVVANNPWNNRDIRFDNYFDDHKGTAFTIKKGNAKELAMMPGLQIREMK